MHTGARAQAVVAGTMRAGRREPTLQESFALSSGELHSGCTADFVGPDPQAWPDLRSDVRLVELHCTADFAASVRISDRTLTRRPRERSGEVTVFKGKQDHGKKKRVSSK